MSDPTPSTKKRVTRQRGDISLLLIAYILFVAAVASQAQ